MYLLFISMRKAPLLDMHNRKKVALLFFISCDFLTVTLK